MRPSTRSLLAGAGATAVAAALAAAPALPAQAHGGEGRQVQVRDECEHVSFDEALFPGACDPAFGGGVTFGQLLQELQADPAEVLAEREVLGWRFNPDETQAEAGDVLVLTSRGGEGHTFTEVPAFGGGCVEEVNVVMGLGVHPLCAVEEDGMPGPDWLSTFIAPGATMTTPALTEGTHHFECLIHPWMRTTVTVG